MRDNALKLGLIGAAMLLGSAGAHAAGLGRLTLYSTLGQALNAEIELISIQKGETITARFAAPELYQEAGAQYNNALTGARVTVEKRPNGQLYLKATTPRPITEPFLELLIEINSENGRMVRQYTALLDPPGYGRAAGEIPPPVSPPAARAPAAAAPEAPVTAPTAAPIAAAPAAPSVAPAQRSTPIAGARQYGPIKPGETPARIARSVKPEGVSVEQTLLGIYRQNPDAFINKNINLVKSGKILTVPEAEQLAAVPHRQAVQELRLQISNFESYSRRVASRAGAAREEGSAGSGSVAASAAEQAGEAPRDTVRVSRGEPPAKARGGGRASPADRVRTLEEEAITREKALADANARIAQLEQIIKDSQRAVDLKSPAPAAPQKGTDKSASAATAPGPAAVAPPVPGPVAAAPPAAQGVQPGASSTVDRSAGADKPAPPAAEPPRAADTAPDVALPKPQPAPKPAASPPAAQPASPEPGFIDTLTSEPAYLGAAAGVVVLLGALAMMMARRRRTAGLAEADDEVRIAPSLRSSYEEEERPTPPAPPAPTSSALDLAVASAAAAAAAGTAASPSPPEPVRELPPSTTEDLLTGSPAAAPPAPPPTTFDPADDDLDFHAGTRSVAPPSTIERATAARAFAADAGRAREPDAHDARVRPAEPVWAGNEAPRAAPEPTLDRGEEAPLEPLMSDFALDTPPAASTAVRPVRSPPADEDQPSEFDLEPLPPLDAPMDIEKVSSEPPASLDFKLDLADFDIDAPAAVTEGAPRDDQWYDVQQKFDLAKAYEEMGDKDGARDILREVLSEGDAEQQTQAKKLLGSL